MKYIFIIYTHLFQIVSYSIFSRYIAKVTYLDIVCI